MVLSPQLTYEASESSRASEVAQVFAEEDQDTRIGLNVLSRCPSMRGAALGFGSRGLLSAKQVRRSITA